MDLSGGKSMSESRLPVPAYVRLARTPGVYPGKGRLHLDQWTSVYLDQGAYWPDWLEQRQLGQEGITKQLLELYASLGPVGDGLV
jgi:hypothetical protein